MIGRLAEPCSTALLKKSTVRAQPEAIKALEGERGLGDCGLPAINCRYESKLPKKKDKSYSG